MPDDSLISDLTLHASIEELERRLVAIETTEALVELMEYVATHAVEVG